MVHRKLLVLSLCATSALILNNSGFSRGLADSSKTKVLVVGTVHQRHSTDTNYTYQDIVNILSTYNPDVICVEIRPKEFRKEPYLAEMIIATIWGIIHGKKVCPIDWWADDTRHIRDSLMKLAEYKKKGSEVEALEAKDSIISNFKKKYGTWKDQGQMGYGFWNGKEYDDYTMEDYRLSMEVFGDSPINLFYRTRNDSMAALILHSISENPARKVMVVTGCEHKHYFDRALMRSPNVSLVEFSNILPLTKKQLDAPIESYFDENNDLPYYERGYPQDINEYYRTKIIPLLHGQDMDFNPSIVPARNILVAKKVIERWRKDTSASVASDIIEFELGWVNFLKGDYREAIRRLLPLSRRIEVGTVDDTFLRATTHRNLGLAYDCIGEREKAIACYILGEKLASSTSFAPVIKLMFRNYKTQPYHQDQH